MAYCTSCGNRMDVGSLFCTACGARTELTVAPPIPAVKNLVAAASPVTASATLVSVAPTVPATYAPPRRAPLPAASPAPPSRKGDLRLKVIAGASVLVSVAGCVAGLLGAIPSGVSTIIVMIAVSIGLRVAWAYAAKSASSSGRARTMRIVSNVGLAISGVTLIISLPRITQAAGMGAFVEDAAGQLWTMALLTAIALPVRTLGWRVYTGTALTGFLGITGLARFLGRPVIESLGTSSVFAIAVWVPMTEELVKLIPVGIVLWVALRRLQARPSALDVMLLGAWTGAGFAAYESATLGRGHFSFLTPPLVSFAFPGEGSGKAFGWPLVQTGHLGHTALIALSLALALFYSRRTKRLTLIFPLVACGAVLLEHCSQNALAENGLNEVVAKIAVILSLGGYLTALLLLAEIAFVLHLEWRIVGGGLTPSTWLRLKPEEVMRRSVLLARAQTGGAA